jgi:CubicO group peptidase (beta-lactamase class C family)
MRRRTIMKNLNRTFALIVLVAFGSVQGRSQSLYFPPSVGNWSTMNPQELGWCNERIDSLLNFLENNQSKAFVLLKDGKIVLESYFNGHSASSNWYWASAGKTLTAFMVGQAQQQGFFSILDPTSDHLGPGWSNCTPEQEQAITIRNQLCMTTGLDDGVPDHYCTLDTCLNYLAEPGTRWAYHNGPYTLLDSVMEVTTGLSLNAWCTQQVAQPIGMQGLWLNIDYNNVYFSNARSMARFGLLMLAEGVWNGNDLLQDPEYFYDMTHASQSINEGYGYLTWLNNTESFMLPETQFVFPGNYAPNAPLDMYAAIGRDGQFICVVPSQQLVWIRMGENPEQLDVPILMIDDIWERINELTCSSVSTEDLTMQDLSVYPNPANEHWSVSGCSGSCVWSIYDLIGNLIKTGHEVADNAFEIDATSISAGSYILQVIHNGQSYRSTITRQ